jgi:hypothetical protein
MMRGLARTALALGVLMGGAAGCQVLSGIDDLTLGDARDPDGGSPDDASADGDATARPDARTVDGTPDGDASKHDGDPSTLDGGPDADAGDGGPTCAAGTKSCNGTCVPVTDPTTGCANAGCAPCALPQATATCSAGRCAIGGCATGFADCDVDAGDGCEANLAKPDHCGACTKVCDVAAPLCSGSGSTYACATGCTAPASTVCGTQCVDVTNSAAHCGDCATACTAPINGDPSCSARKCDYSCHASFHKCAATSQCAADSDVNACGASCTKCPVPTNATAKCTGGQCGFTCNLGSSLCGGACLATSSDPANCGACGHSCQGGTCSAGRCTAVTLASARSTPENLVVDAFNLYWGESASNGTIYKCGKSGCSDATIVPLADGHGSGPIAVTSSTVYFAAEPTIYACAAGGCGNAPTAFASNVKVFDLRADATTLYWSTFTDRSVKSCPITGCATPATVLENPARLVNQLALSPNEVFFAAQYSGGIPYQGSQILRCNKQVGSCLAGAQLLTIVDHAKDGTNESIGAVSYNGSLYVAQGTTSGTPAYSVAVCPEGGCTGAAPKIWTGSAEVTALATDSSGAYWASGGSIYACPGNACSSGATLLATGAGAVSAIAADGAVLYFTTADAVRKIAK